MKVYVFHERIKPYMPDLDILDENEKRRIFSIADPKARITKAWSYVFLKRILSKFFHIKDVDVIRPKNQKPFLRSGPFFNTSHSDDHLVIAISFDGPIGIDIEKLKENVKYSAISKNFFSQKEHRKIIEAEKPVEEFYDLWTRKEAFIKLIGGSVFSQKFRKHGEYENEVKYISIGEGEIKGYLCLLNSVR